MLDTFSIRWYFFFFSSRRRHTRLSCDWSSDVCSSDRSEEHTSELQSHDNLVCRIIRSEEHTSELQSHDNLVCRLLLEKKKKAKQPSEKLANYNHARRGYGDYLDPFPKDADSPTINYRLADLLLENHDFGEAAKQYERTAYGYPANPRSAGAGYAAVYAHREQLKAASPAQLDVVKRNTIASSFKFADTFPQHEHAAEVLGAAADDMYEMKDYRQAVAAAQRLIDRYPNGEAAIRRSAWIVVAHGSFELAEYPQAERAYTQVLAATPKDDKSRAGFVDNLAA